MRPLLAPLLVALAVALGPVVFACHPGAIGGLSAGAVGASPAEMSFYPSCSGPVTVYLVIGGVREYVPATLSVVAPDVDNLDCVIVSCGGADPPAALLRLDAPAAGLALLGLLEYPHIEAGRAFIGAVHGLPAGFVSVGA